MTWVPLWQVAEVDPTVVPECNFVLDQNVSLTLEYGARELNSSISELSVHYMSVSEVILGVEEVGCNFSVNIHIFKDSLTFSLCKAVCFSSKTLKVVASV